MNHRKTNASIAAYGFLAITILNGAHLVDTANGSIGVKGKAKLIVHLPVRGALTTSMDSIMLNQKL